MTKIADRDIIIPNEVDFFIEKGKIEVKGPLGRNELLLNPEVKIIRQENKLVFIKLKKKIITGTFNSLIYNMIQGVTTGYKKILEIKGTGYNVTKVDNNLILRLGRANNDNIHIPLSLGVKVERNKIIITGVDKQKVSLFAANIRDLRRPNIYKKDKGIYYLGEKIKIKIKKKGKGAG